MSESLFAVALTTTATTGPPILRVVHAGSDAEALGKVLLDIGTLEDLLTYTILPVVKANISGLKQIVIDLLLDGKRIGAIKRVSEITGYGLKEAKAYVDTIQNTWVPF